MLRGSTIGGFTVYIHTCTCIDTSSYTCTCTLHVISVSKGSKRRHPDNDDDDDTEYKEELWSLRDVIFLSPPFSSARIGRVMKLDGFYAAILFPSLNKDSNEKGEDKATPTSEEDNEEQNKEQTKDTSVLSQCRLLRRDDLVVCL